MNLRLVPDLPDPHSKPLPVKWDGHEIGWRPWDPAPVTTLVGATADDCPECGYSGPGWTSRSMITSQQILRGHDHLLDLRVDRCGKCLHDQVTDIATWETWDLDPLDYGPEGSWDWIKK